MIARIWRGATAARDAAEYVGYLKQTGLAEYRSTPGNLGAHVLWRIIGDKTEFVTLSFWDSREAVKAFAGDDIEQAVFYPEDDRYLVERDLTVTHFEAVSG